MTKNSQKSRSLRENENRWMGEKSHGEKIEVVRENGESTGRDSGQGCIVVRVMQLRPTTRETQNHLDFESKKNLNEINLFWLEAENLAIETYNDLVRTIKWYFDIWFIFKNFCNI